MEALKSIVEVDDKMEFLEQVTAHLCEGRFERSNDPIDRKLIEMVNLLEARQIAVAAKVTNEKVTPLKNISSDENKSAKGTQIILTNFILPGVLN